MKIFFCHTSRDKPLLREVRRWLPRPVQVWLDEERLLIMLCQINKGMITQVNFVVGNRFLESV